MLRISTLLAWGMIGACVAVCRADDAAPAFEPNEAKSAAPVAGPALDPQQVEFFEKEIRPLLSAKCDKCHSHQSESVRGGLYLDTRAGWTKGGDTGPAIIPGDPDASLAIQAIRYDGDYKMPPDGKLPDEQIAALTKWVKLGAPDPRTAQPSKEKRKPIDIAEMRKHWAYQPLSEAKPPEAPANNWVKNPVDLFILAKLNEKQLTPNPIADRRVLIRRAYLDLIGLPPSIEEVEAFVNDPASDAYERLVDRLLASEHFGERWARHWLDLARFAESHGFEHDYDRPTAYHYRDFVIRAFNQDLPYDQFIKWQLAGDEYEPENPMALAATGYLAAGVHSTQITKNQVEKERYDELDDITATVGTSLFGLTIGCARCHDHKFDAIPVSDYYRLLSTFTTAVRSEIDVDLDPTVFAKAKGAYDAEHAPLTQALASYIEKDLPGKLDAFLAAQTTAGQPVTAAKWQLLSPVSTTSKAGATFQTLPDGSLLASGTNGDADDYSVVIQTHQRGITGLRIEALAHEKLPKHGPGRADNGNFALSDVSVAVAPLTGEAEPTPIKLAAARATYEQNGLPVAATIDDDKKSAWAVDGKIGQDNSAALDFVSPLDNPSGAKITIKLAFHNNKGHNLGRFRLALSTAATPLTPDGDAAPQNAAEILALAASGAATAETRSRMLGLFEQVDPRCLELAAAVSAHASHAPQPKLTKMLVTSEGLPAVRLHTQGDDFLKETHFLERGDPNRKKDVATQSFLQVLMTTPDGERAWQTPPPAGWRTSFRRRALAEWATDTKQGGGHLLARVIVNRLWQHHFGRGIVGTPSDFGTQGERPTHPELLDHLAGELIRGGWKLKPIHRLIMTSAVYTEGSQSDAAHTAVDPDNKLLWRRQRYRLEAEVIRDAMLATGGILDETMFGPGTLDENHRRRSVYFTVKRSKLASMMVLFDAPDALQGLGARSSTTIAPQALLLLNNSTVRDSARAFAARATTGPDAGAAAVRRAYLIGLSRAPDETELADAVAFLDAQSAQYTADGKADARQLAMTDLCQVILGLNEFVYVD